MHLVFFLVYPYAPPAVRYKVRLMLWDDKRMFRLAVSPVPRSTGLTRYSPLSYTPPEPPVLPPQPEVELPVPSDTFLLPTELRPEPPQVKLSYEVFPEVPKPPRFDEELELLSTADIERAGIRRFALVDPEERRGLEGFVLLARTTRGRLLDRLADYINKHTKIRVRVTQDYAPIQSPNFQDSPIAFVVFRQKDTSGVGVDTLRGVLRGDLELLGRYLLGGGFLVLAKVEQYDQLRRYLEREHGGKFEFFKFLPPEDPYYVGYVGPVRGPDHPVFHSFYDIDLASIYERYRRQNVELVSVYRRHREPFCYEGAELDGRLVAFAPYTVPFTSDTVEISPEVLLGVNLVVFALAQPGGRGYRLVRHRRPHRSYEGEPDAYLALVRAGGIEPVDLGEVGAFLDERALGGVDRGDAVLFGPLSGGRHRLRLVYRGRETALDVLLKGRKVVKVGVGLQRMFWVRKFKASVEGEGPIDANLDPTLPHKGPRGSPQVPGMDPK